MANECRRRQTLRSSATRRDAGIFGRPLRAPANRPWRPVLFGDQAARLRARRATRTRHWRATAPRLWIQTKVMPVEAAPESGWGPQLSNWIRAHTVRPAP